jgi:hypothetical protein
VLSRPPCDRSGRWPCGTHAEQSARLGGGTGRKCRTHRGGEGCRVGLVGERATSDCLLASARAELGIGQALVLGLSQGRRLDQDTLQAEVSAWAKRRNAFGAAVDWQFTMDDARTKLKRLYPSAHE